MYFRDFVFPYGILMPTGPPHVQWKLISLFYKMRKVRLHSAKKDGLRSYRRSPGCLAASHGPFSRTNARREPHWLSMHCMQGPFSITITLKRHHDPVMQWLLAQLYLQKIIIYFNWRPITLQYCGAFCHTLTWISHGCTCVPALWTPLLLPSLPHPIPSGLSLALSALLHSSNLHWSFILHMIVYMFQCYSLKSSHPCLLSQSLKACSYIHFAALHIGSLLSSF